MPRPTEECFAGNKLEFVSDELYGAPPDANHPERAYLAPASVAAWTNGPPGETHVYGAEYRMKFRLPEGVAGGLVLLQWYYLTANSCKHPGYDEYPFPEEWGADVDFYPALPDCESIPEDGDGVPEQVRKNCACQTRMPFLLVPRCVYWREFDYKHFYSHLRIMLSKVLELCRN